MRPLRLSSDPWAAAWSHDRTALAQALALAAAYPAFVGSLTIEITGDVEAALGGLLADLARAGLGPDDLPAVGLVAAPADRTARPSIGGLPAFLAASCEYERRPWLPVFPVEDDRHQLVWEAAARHPGRATVLAETLEGLEAISDPGRIAVVSGNPALRRLARRRGLRADPRPPAGRHLPGAEAVIVDARRPDDLMLAAGGAAPVVAVNGAGVTRLALDALGADAISVPDHGTAITTDLLEGASLL